MDCNNKKPVEINLSHRE